MKYLRYFVVLKQMFQATLGLTTPSEASDISTMLHQFKDGEGYTEFAYSTHESVKVSMGEGMQEKGSQHESEYHSHDGVDRNIWTEFINVNVEINRAGEYTCKVCNLLACRQHGLRIAMDIDGKRIHQISK